MRYVLGIETSCDDTSVAVVDETGAVRKHSQTALQLFGSDPDGALIVPPRLMQQALDAIKSGKGSSLRKHETGGTGGTLYLEYTVTPSETVSFSRGRGQAVRIATLSIRDITTQKQQERDIAYLSSYDALTGALRRGVFIEFIQMRLEAREPFAVFAFNLSRFKTVNTVLGRPVGDALLQTVVKRLEDADVNTSAVARLGGDTFACFTEFATDQHDAAILAKRIADIVSAPYKLDGSHASVGVNTGYAVIAPDKSISAQEALTRAEESLDSARQEGDSTPRPFNPVISARQFRSRQIERAMGQALDREEFEVWYQPQHCVRDLRLTGSEALIRWKSGTLGQVFPDEFIEIAESTGFIHEIGAWIIEKAIADTSLLPEHLTVAVNVSGVQMASGDIVCILNNLLQKTGFPASRLWLELTETVLFDGTGEHVEKMRDIQFRGVRWALDDFGTGYSSLGQLSRLPINKLKVDKSLISGLGSDPAAQSILEAVEKLCRKMGMIILCEGVETQEHLNFLRAHHVGEAQGYLFGKPMPFSEFQEYARKHRHLQIVSG